MTFMQTILRFPFPAAHRAALVTGLVCLSVPLFAQSMPAGSDDPWPQTVKGLPTPTSAASPVPTATATTVPLPPTPVFLPTAIPDAQSPAQVLSTPSPPASPLVADPWPQDPRSVGSPSPTPSPDKPAVLRPLVIPKNTATPTPDPHWPQATPGAAKVVLPPTPTPDPAWPQSPPPKAEDWKKLLAATPSPQTSQPIPTTIPVSVSVPQAVWVRVSLDGLSAVPSNVPGLWEVPLPVSPTPQLQFTLDPKVKGYRSLDVQIHPALNNLPETHAGLILVTREPSRGFQPGQKTPLTRLPAGVAVLSADGQPVQKAELEPGHVYLARFTVTAVENSATLTVRFTTEKK